MSCVEHQISIFYVWAVGMLGVDQVWWIKWQQDIILNYWGKQRQRDVSNKWSRTGLTYYIVCYLYLSIYSLSLYYLMIQNLKIPAFWDVIICQLVNNLAVNLGQAVHWTNGLLGCDCEASAILRYTSNSVPSVRQKLRGIKFSKSWTGSHMTYSCHHNSSNFTSPIFVNSWRFSVFHSLHSITPCIQDVPGGKVTTWGFNPRADSESKTYGFNLQQLRNYEF
jgi:hypothetical protein